VLAFRVMNDEKYKAARLADFDYQAAKKAHEKAREAFINDPSDEKGEAEQAAFARKAEAMATLRKAQD
jgi:hypothetical protein